MTTQYNRMDPRYTRETSEHLEKQNELLWDAYRSMTHELHKLQVEEEMLMRKFFEVMSAHGLTKRKKMLMIFWMILWKVKMILWKAASTKSPEGQLMRPVMKSNRSWSFINSGNIFLASFEILKKNSFLDLMLPVYLKQKC